MNVLPTPRQPSLPYHHVTVRARALTDAVFVYALLLMLITMSGS